MIRILLFLIVISAISLIGAWVLEHNGSLTINWLGYHIEASLFFIFVALLVGILLLFLTLLVLLWLRSAPHRITKHYADVKRDKGMAALTQGFVAVAAGDAISARKLAKLANHKLGKTPLTLLLQTQTAQMEGNDAEVKQCLTSLLENKETELIALKGMLLQAQKQGNLEEAITLAERAYALNPHATWVTPVLADLYKHTQSWEKARKMLEESSKKDKPSHDKQRMLGILLLSQARDALQAGNADAALKFSYRANKLLPGFVPGAVILAEILQKLGKTKKAAHMLEQHWATTPHPDIAKAYHALYADETPEKQLKHMERLVSGAKEHPESHWVIAHYALQAENFNKARSHLKSLLDIRPTVSAYKMMYELEKLEGSDAESLQSWIDKAANATQDTAWVCKECSFSNKSRWEAICSNCDHFDSFQWKEASPVHVLNSL